MTEHSKPGAAGVAGDVAGAIGCALAIVLGCVSWWAAADYSALGSVFPRAIGALLVVLGVTYLALFASGRTRRAAALDGSNARRAGVALVMLAWAYTLEPLGFLGSSALAMAALLFVANHESRSVGRLAGQALAAALLLVGLYALFKHALNVPLP